MNQPATTAAFDTRIAVVVDDGLETWQKLNVTAFVVSGVAATVAQVVGEPYEDGSGQRYLPMFRQPVMIYSTSREKLTTVYGRALRRGVQLAIYTADLFTTYNDADNRAAVRAVPADELNLVGLAFRADRREADKILKGVSRQR